MNPKGNAGETIRLKSETVDYVLDRERRQRLFGQSAKHMLHQTRTPRHTDNRRRWLARIMALFAILMALLLAPLSTANAQAPWQMDGGEDGYHPAVVEYRVGLFHLVREEWEPAIARFDEAVRLLPGYAAAFEARGYCYEALGNVEQAVADYEQAIYLTPEYGPTYRLLADLYYEQGEQVLALEYYRMVVSLTGEALDLAAVERVAELEAALS